MLEFESDLDHITFDNAIHHITTVSSDLQARF